MTAPLRRVFVRAPGTEVSRWREYGWRSEPDPERLADEHAGVCATLGEAGAEVVIGEPAPDGNIDAIYVFDPALVSDAGAILLRPGMESRRDETTAIRADFEASGIPIAAELTAPALAEGGDALWLEERGVHMIEVPDEEFDSMGCNVLAMAPRVGLALDGNPETRRRMEAVGVEVRVYTGEELSRKGDGGPTCLTRPLARG